MKTISTGFWGRLTGLNSTAINIRASSIVRWTLPAVVTLLLLPQAVQAQKAGVADVAETDPGLFMVMMIILAGVIGAFALVAALTCLLALVLICLSAVGVVSLSIIVAWYKRSIHSGFAALLHLLFVPAGAVGGLLALIIWQRIARGAPAGWDNYVIAGLIGGLAGWLMTRVVRKLFGALFKSLSIYARG